MYILDELSNDLRSSLSFGPLYLTVTGHWDQATDERFGD